jgi:hypothetical protein
LGNTTTSPKACDVVPESLQLEVQMAVDEETATSECLTTEQAPRVPSPSLSLLEAAADVASSLEDAVDAVIQSSPRARRRKLQLAENSDPMSVLQGGYFSGSRSSLHTSDSGDRLQSVLDRDWSMQRLDPWSVEHSTSESSTEAHQEDKWDENCRQHLVDFAEKLSEKLLEEIDQYQKQTCQQSPMHTEVLEDQYLLRLSQEIEELSKLTEELQERTSYLAGLNNNCTILEMHTPSLVIEDPLNVTEVYDPFLDTTLYPRVATEVESNFVVVDVYKQTEEKPQTDGNPAVDNESSASDVIVVCNSCPRQTSDDITEDIDTCVEVLCKGDDGELQETPPDGRCETKDESVSIAPSVASECDDAEPSHLSVSVISLRPACSVDSIEAGNISGVNDSADKTARTVSADLSDAVTGSSNGRSRDTRNTGIQEPCCNGTASSETPAREGGLEAATQEPPKVLTKEESCTSSISASTSQESLPSDNGGGAITFHRYYHVFREGELDQLIERYVENLHIISSYYDHANWCVVAEKVHVWTI